MKKIERFVVWESSNEAKHCNHQAVISQKKCMVNIADLDELEQENKLFYENWQTFVAIANEQRIARVAIRQQRDEAIEILISIYTSLDNGLVDHYEDVKKLLENVTGQTWEEIKAGKR